MTISGYQFGSRWQGTRINIALIASYLDRMAVSALDIGSNEGAITCALGLAGLKARGVEMNPKYVSRGRLLAAALQVPIDFEVRTMSLEDIERMAPVDVTAFLSVHHQIAALHGLDHANNYLRALARKTVRQLFFMPACISEKYGSNSPSFVNNDFSAIIEYFSDLVSDEMPYIQVIGFSQNDLPKHEPLRPMILFSRSPVVLQHQSEAVPILADIERAISQGSLLSSLSYFGSRLFNRGR